jgi:curved DNA-binding protein CbpA
MRWRSVALGHKDRLEALQLQQPHERLGVAPDANPDEVKRAYRLKVLAYHPDRLDPFLRAHGEEVMKLLNQAYRALLGEKRR